MNCVSWNIRGLECPDRKFVINNFISSRNNIDMIMLQEIKSTGFNLQSNLNFIWRDSIKFSTNHPQGRGGMVIFLRPKWGPKIKSFGFSPHNRAIWLSFNHNDMDFGICFVYATNDYTKRSMFWSWLSSLGCLEVISI